MTGYLSSAYAESLKEFGKPLYLEKSKSWVLEREVQGSSYSDAMGFYPLFMCDDWGNLNSDFEKLHNLASITVVTDPFGNYDMDTMKCCFKNLVVPFKTHFVIDLNRYDVNDISQHHKRNIKGSKQYINVEHCPEPVNFLYEWTGLYNCLIEKHNIAGIRAFSKKAFEYQLNTPGIEMFRAIHNGSTVGIIIWYIINETGYYHLAAYNDSGYEYKASYALFDFSIKYLSEKVKWLNLGAGAGLNNDSNDGLTRFKKGWANDTRTSYLCGRVLDQDMYKYLSELKGFSGNGYFPIYRKGEFT